MSVAYGTNLVKAQEVLLQAVQGCALVARDPAPGVALTGFAPSSLEFTIVVWSRAASWVEVQDQVRRAVYESLNRAHFDIPFPRTIVEQITAHA